MPAVRCSPRAPLIRMLSMACWLLSAAFFASPAVAGDDGFESIFDGKSLKGWDGNPKFWRVENGAIVGQTTKENPTKGNTFLIWRDGKTGDFELTLEYRIVGGNSGIQYRSFEVSDMKWVVGGYQADFEAGDMFSGILYGERFRGVMALRGQKTVLREGQKQPEVVGSVGDSNEIQKKIKKEDWNTYHVTARGYHFVHQINGVTTCECTDEDAKQRRDTGILALQVHAGPPMKVEFRNIRLKRLKRDKGDKAASTKPAATKKIAFIAGKPSHGYGQHEHRAGCLLLAKALNENMPGIQADVYTGGWPQDSHVLDDVASIVIYCDGGDGHPLNQHLAEIDRLMKKGVGLACIHYAVEIPRGEPGDKLLDWTGGYFEANWSVNPHWTADYAKLPKHEISRGVKPFVINDEWYYHMRFRENMEDVTPILTAVPPKESLDRPDGTHSGNKYVRAEIGKSQHMAWARQRPDGGRGFGFTGGHFHWNWGHDQFRKLVLNAIVWTAGVDVPPNGVPSHTLTVEDLEANQDEQPPADYNRARIQKMLDEWHRSSAG